MEFDVLRSDLIIVTATIDKSMTISRVFKDVDAASNAIKNLTRLGYVVAVLVGANFNPMPQVGTLEKGAF
jgi:hypothetical protein